MWGTGTPQRKSLYADYLADTCLIPLESFDVPGPINNGTGGDINSCILAESVCEEAGYQGEIPFDTIKPDGTSRVLLDVMRMAGFGWTTGTPIRVGAEGNHLVVPRIPTAAAGWTCAGCRRPALTATRVERSP